MSELPEGWAECTLGDLLVGIDAGRSFRCEERPPKDHEFGVIKISAVSWGKYDETESKTCTNPKLVEPSFLIKDGDLLLSRANTIELVGASVIAESVTKRIMLSDKVLRLRTQLDVDKKWILYFLRSHAGRSQIEALATGNQQSMRNIGQDRLRSIVLPLPPHAEQRRIVERVGALLFRTNAARARLKRVDAIVNVLRESIEAAACFGKLSEDWRKEHPAAEDARTLVEHLLRAHDAAGGHKRGNAAEPTEEAHDLDPASLPTTWSLTELRAAVSPDAPITYGILKPGPDIEGGIPYVRVADFPEDHLNLRTLKRTTPQIERQYARARLSPGDILLSIRGTVGRVCIVPNELNSGNITQDTARLRIQDAMDCEYVAWFLRAKPTQDRMRRAMKGVAVHGINIGDVRAIQLPVPPRGEQEEIVRRIRALIRAADTIHAYVRAATARVDRLTQAILTRAFSGELVPTEADLARREARSYERGSVLLERIRAERQRNQAPRSHRNRASVSRI